MDEQSFFNYIQDLVSKHPELNDPTKVAWSILDLESEASCSSTDEYYLERLFFAVESHDVTIVKTFSDEHLRHLCRIRRLFQSEWAAPAQEKQSAYQRACLLGYTDIVQYMLQAGIRVDQIFRCGGNRDIQRSAFMFACHSGSLNTMRALLQALSGNPIEHYKTRNRKATCSASFAKQYLIPQNYWVENSSDSATNHLELVCPINLAIAQNNLEMAQLIVTGPNGELETRNLWEPFQHGRFTPLHIACLFNRSIEMVKLLLSLGEADVNPLLQTTSQGLFADEMTNDRTLIDYLRPTRVSILSAMEQERLKDLEEMQSGRSYQIFIKPLSGDTLTLTVTGHTMTAQLGMHLQNECGIPLIKQKLLFCGRVIPIWEEDSQPLVYYNIKKDSILNIIWHNPKITS